MMFSDLKERFGKVNTTYVANINTSVVLKCNPPSGYPLPSVSWVKDGRLLGNKELGTSNMRLTKKKKNLFIRKLKTRKTGKYQCVVKNFAGTRRGPVISLIVKGNIMANRWRRGGGVSSSVYILMEHSFASLIVLLYWD